MRPSHAASIPRLGAAGSGSQHDEYAVKAAFLVKFIKYTNWPEGSFESKDSPIVVLLLGHGSALRTVQKTLSGKDAQGRSIHVVTARDVPRSIDAHVVYAIETSDSQRTSLIDACERRAILLLGDHSAYTRAGATMNFYLDKERVRFAVNTDALKLARLVLSSQVLKLAKIVKSDAADK